MSKLPRDPVKTKQPLQVICRVDKSLAVWPRVVLRSRVAHFVMDCRLDDLGPQGLGRHLMLLMIISLFLTHLCQPPGPDRCSHSTSNGVHTSSVYMYLRQQETVCKAGWAPKHERQIANWPGLFVSFLSFLSFHPFIMDDPSIRLGWLGCNKALLCQIAPWLFAIALL